MQHPSRKSQSPIYANLGKQAKGGEEASSRLQWGTGRGSGNQDLKLHHWGESNTWVWRGINSQDLKSKVLWAEKLSKKDRDIQKKGTRCWSLCTRARRRNRRTGWKWMTQDVCCLCTKTHAYIKTWLYCLPSVLYHVRNIGSITQRRGLSCSISSMRLFFPPHLVHLHFI